MLRCFLCLIEENGNTDHHLLIPIQVTAPVQVEIDQFNRRTRRANARAGIKHRIHVPTPLPVKIIGAGYGWLQSRMVTLPVVPTPVPFIVATLKSQERPMTLQYVGIEMLKSPVYLFQLVFKRQIRQRRLRQQVEKKMIEDRHYESLIAKGQEQEQEQAAWDSLVGPEYLELLETDRKSDENAMETRQQVEWNAILTCINVHVLLAQRSAAARLPCANLLIPAKTGSSRKDTVQDPAKEKITQANLKTEDPVLAAVVLSPTPLPTELQGDASTEPASVIVKDTDCARETTIEPRVSDHSFIIGALLISSLALQDVPLPSSPPPSPSPLPASPLPSNAELDDSTTHQDTPGDATILVSPPREVQVCSDVVRDIHFSNTHLRKLSSTSSLRRLPLHPPKPPLLSLNLDSSTAYPPSGTVLKSSSWILLSPPRYPSPHQPSTIHYPTSNSISMSWISLHHKKLRPRRLS